MVFKCNSIHRFSLPSFIEGFIGLISAPFLSLCFATVKILVAKIKTAQISQNVAAVTG